MSKQLTTEEIEQLRPQEGMTAEEFDKLRQNNQPSRAQQVRNGDILPVEKQEESEPAPEPKEESKPAAKREVKDVPKPEAKEAPKPAAKKATTTAKKTTARKTAARSTKK